MNYDDFIKFFIKLLGFTMQSINLKPENLFNQKENPLTTITLNTPIKAGDNQITELTLTKPMIGQVRGVKIFDLLQGDTDAYIELLPRITSPAINKAQAANLELTDFLQLIEVVAEWFTAGKSAIPTAS